VALKSPNDSDFQHHNRNKRCNCEPDRILRHKRRPSRNKTLCVWRTNATAQFIRQSDITPTNGTFSLSIDGNSIYTISTTTDQQKGTFATAVPPQSHFLSPTTKTTTTIPIPRRLAICPIIRPDICGVFEITDRPTKRENCLRQVVTNEKHPAGGLNGCLIRSSAMQAGPIMM